jgi:ABC-type sugar transport system permease subunit
MEITPTWNHALRIWWAYFWRSLGLLCAALILSFILGILIGLIMNLSGAPESIMRPLSTIIGLVIGFSVSILPMKLILGKDFGTFRLVLLKKDGVPPRAFT